MLVLGLLLLLLSLDRLIASAIKGDISGFNGKLEEVLVVLSVSLGNGIVKCGNGPDIYASDYCFATFDLGSAMLRDQLMNTVWLGR
jgi:hypothetical protein